MMKILGKFLQMRMRDRILLLIAFMLLLSIKLGLWLLPFHRLLNLVQRISQPGKYIGYSSLSKLIWAVNVATRYIPANTKCLARALAMQILMAWHGYKAELCIGVVKGEAGNIEAHAWLEYQSQIIIGDLPDLPRFIPLSSLAGVKI